MTVNYTMRPGQWQIGDTLFGRHTLIRVIQVDSQPGDVAAQDFQVPQSDEIRFGQDAKKPGGITFTLGIYENKAIAHTALAGSPAMNFSNDVGAEQLAEEWNAYVVRTTWGVPLALRKCSNKGVVQRIYGRPGKFGIDDPTRKSEFRTVQCEFRRIDDKVYSDTEYFSAFEDNSIQHIQRVDGRSSSWCRFLLYGEMKHPTINFNGQQIKLNYDLGVGEVVEISSYPWQRRCVNSGGFNLSAALDSDSPYLDQITFPARTTVDVSWTAEEIHAGARMVFLWRDAYSVVL